MNIFKIILIFIFLPKELRFAQVNDSIEHYLNYSNKYQSRNSKLAYYYAVKALKLAEQQHDSLNILKSLQNLADVYWYSNQLNKSLETYLKILQITDSARYPAVYAYALYGIGWIECVQKNKFDKMNYLNRSHKIFLLLKDTLNQVYVLNGIETSYFKRYNDEPSHKEFLEKSIEYNLKARNLILEKPIYRTVLLQSDISLAGLLIERNLYDSVYKIIKRIEHVPIKSENIKRLLISLKLNYFYKIKKYDSCYNIIRYHTNLLNKSSNEDKLEYLKVKFNVLKNLNKFKDAMNVCDTIIFTYPLYYNELILSKTEDFEYNQKITKKELSIRLLNEKNKIEILKNKQKNILIILTLFAFILSLAFLILTLKNKKKIQELNKGLALQKLLLEEKNHEITQSINYASRIQQALLKQNIPPSLISSIHDSFILYLPKDIVSGDFYWIFKTEKLNEYIGVFDCTGHGVPGSFVSLMNLNLLIESVKVANKIFPDEILNYVREKIILLLNLDEYQKDGMDGSLLFFPENFSSTRIAFYAAANNPLFLISDRQVFVSEYDKMPVGKSEHKIPFKKHEIKITSGTKIFLSTDGFKDQFGGNMNKRLGSKKFRELLTEISELPLIEQKTFLLDFFNKWKNQNEQTDDICIMGIEC